MLQKNLPSTSAEMIAVWITTMTRDISYSQFENS